MMASDYRCTHCDRFIPSGVEHNCLTMDEIDKALQEKEMAKAFEERLLRAFKQWAEHHGIATGQVAMVTRLILRMIG